jgi:hypothetical protein
MSVFIKNISLLALSISFVGLTAGCGEETRTSEVYQFGDPAAAEGNGGGDSNGEMAAGNPMENNGAAPAPTEPTPSEPTPTDPEPTDPAPNEAEPTNPEGMMSGGGNMGSAGAAQGELGAACTGNADCNSGLCVTDMPGGYCSAACETAEDCGAGGSCWNLGADTSLCLLNCMDTSECRGDAGYICDSDNTCFPNGSGGGGSGGASGPGAQVGDTITDFSLTNCGTGEATSVQATLAGSRAGMMILTAGWCGACAQWIPQIRELEANPQAEGLKVMYVLGEDSNHGQPSERFCQQYANQHNIPLNQMFMDHDGNDSFRTVFSNMAPYTDAEGRFGLPFNALINPATMEYVYADKGPGGDLNAGLASLLQ